MEPSRGMWMFSSSTTGSNSKSSSRIFCSGCLGCLALLCMAFFAASYVAVYHSDNETVQLLSQSKWARPLFFAFQDAKPSILDLEALRSSLAAVAFRNKTVILTTLNKSWAENGSMIDLFLNSFRLGDGTSELLNHLLIVNLDQAAQDRCMILHGHCYSLVTEGVDFSAEKVFMSSDYLKMMWRRVEFLRVVLELGYNFVFTDADIMWFRDPFPHFSPEADFEIACDRFNGNPTDLRNLPNGGFVHTVSNNRTIQFYKTWYQAREAHPGRHDQDVFNDIKYTPPFQKIGLRVRFLDTQFFGGFCQVSGDFDKVCTMHANCCTKLERKLVDLRLVLEDWKRYWVMKPEERQVQRMFWRAPRECLHSFGN